MNTIIKRIEMPLELHDQVQSLVTYQRKSFDKMVCNMLERVTKGDKTEGDKQPTENIYGNQK